MRAFDGGRLARLEETCWRLRCTAAREELKGAHGERALLPVLRLKQELGEPGWLPEAVPDALDTLQVELRYLASNRRRGRPRDKIGQTFRRIMQILLRSVLVLEGGCRELAQWEIDELLAELFSVATGRTISVKSYIRMRKRDRAAANKAISAGGCHPAISSRRVQRRSGPDAPRSVLGSPTGGSG
jgi:hypothetical protein